ncbi:MAG: hypothetical protein ACP5E3_15280, partial [Bacteroidales bacterium]
MKINHITGKFLIFLIVIFVATSCDDKLDEPLEQEFLEENIDYTNTEDMELVLLGAYGNFYFLQWETFPLIGVRGDDVNAAGDQVPLTETDAYRYDPNFWIMNSVW